jgi:ABC-type lipoprotein export system ATPase subunit
LPLLSVNGVSKTYHDKGEALNVLNDTNLSLDSGKIYSLCGPSGAGKTTLLNIIAGLDFPDKGEVWLDGKRIDNRKEHSKAKLRAGPLGVIFQNPNLIGHLSAIENVVLPSLFGEDTHGCRKQGEVLLQKLNLQDKMNKLPSKLSEGERRRVSIARALVTRPRIVLADEPTINLDSVNSQNVFKLLKESVENGVTVLISTHDERVAKMSDKIFRIGFGKIDLAD